MGYWGSLTVLSRVVSKMANGRGTYTVLNDEQKQTLANYYDEGMKSSGPNMHGVIEEAASRAGVSFDKVKVSKLSNTVTVYLWRYRSCHLPIVECSIWTVPITTYSLNTSNL